MEAEIRSLGAELAADATRALAREAAEGPAGRLALTLARVRPTAAAHAEPRARAKRGPTDPRRGVCPGGARDARRRLRRQNPRGRAHDPRLPPFRAATHVA